MINPAEIASRNTLEEIYKALDEHISFRVEAGAGAGKTYSLIKALKRLIEVQSLRLQKKNQRIACITYTNIAKNEINARIDNNPVVLGETIHAFSWLLVQGFQKQIRTFLPTISTKWKKRIDEVGGIRKQQVIYDFGYPKATEEQFFLHHDDVIKIMTHFLSKEKFITILRSKFPIILIDEYQDTNLLLADAIVTNLIERVSGIQIGFFGDHWQKIYGSGACGLIESDKIRVIGKNANFRSDKKIVEMLNRMRPGLTQQEKDSLSQGDLAVFQTNAWSGARRTDNHWQGDMSAESAHEYLGKVKNILTANDWDFNPEKTKVLMLTNNVLAKEQGYFNITKVFNDSDDYLKKNNHYINFLVEILEPVLNYFIAKKYGEMFMCIGRTPRLRNQTEKIQWNNDLNKLLKLRLNGTVGDVIDYLKKTERPRLSSKVEEAEAEYQKLKTLTKFEDEKEQKFVSKVKVLRLIKYSEIIELSKYIDDKTVFSTKHGVKGAQFENVLVVCGRGWNNYNWDNLLSWENDGVPNTKESAHERNRNLFYVACSRPQKRLALLFTQELSNSSIKTLEKWFLKENIQTI